MMNENVNVAGSMEGAVNASEHAFQEAIKTCAENGLGTAASAYDGATDDSEGDTGHCGSANLTPSDFYAKLIKGDQLTAEELKAAGACIIPSITGVANRLTNEQIQQILSSKANGSTSFQIDLTEEQELEKALDAAQGITPRAPLADEDGDIHVTMKPDEKVGETIAADTARCVDDTEDDEDGDEPTEEELEDATTAAMRMRQAANHMLYGAEGEEADDDNNDEEDDPSSASSYQDMMRDTFPSSEQGEPAILAGLSDMPRIKLLDQLYWELYKSAKHLAKLAESQSPISHRRHDRKKGDKRGKVRAKQIECIELDFARDLGKIVTLASTLGLLPNYAAEDESTFNMYNCGVQEMQNYANTLRARADAEVVRTNQLVPEMRDE